MKQLSTRAGSVKQAESGPLFPNLAPSLELYRDLVSRNVLEPAARKPAATLGAAQGYLAARGPSPRETGNLQSLGKYFNRVDPFMGRRLGSMAGGMGRMPAQRGMSGGYMGRAHAMLRLQDQIRREYSTDMHPIARVLQDLMTPDKRRGVADSLKWLAGIPTAKDLQRYTGQLRRAASPLRGYGHYNRYQR